MAREDKHKANTPGKYLVVLLFSAVFALAFGSGGFWFGLKPLVQTLRAAVEVRGWQPVQAQVLGTELQHNSDSDGTTYRVRARYRYEFAGRSYVGTRVGLDSTDTADNISDWHQRWHAQLQGAQAREQAITILVDPRNPAQSLIDPSIRWQMQLFRLPFALVFTGVGLGAAWVFLRALLELLRGKQGDDDFASATDGGPALQAARGARHTGSAVGLVWFFALFWCGIAFPMAGVLWTTGRTPWFAKAFIGLFVVIGFALLAYALRATLMAWRYAGAGLAMLPERPRAGHPVELTLVLPERAAAHQQDQVPHLRLAQYRVDESSSGSPERRVEAFTQPARMQRTADAGLRLAARFHLPADAPPHGAQRSGERVDWRLELLHGGADGKVQLACDVPVQAAPQGFGGAAGEAPADRFDPRAAWNQVTPIAPLAADNGPGAEGEGPHPVPPVLPSTVTLQEAPDGWHYTFDQTGWRWTAALVLLGLAAEAALNARLSAQGLVLPRGLLPALAWCGLLAFALHAATRRWTLSVHDGGLTAHCRSWLWSRTRSVPGEASRSLVHKMLYATGSGHGQQRYCAVYAPGADGALLRLTPGVAGDAGATALGQSIAQSWSHRRGRFSPGAQRPVRASGSRPALGALLLAAALAWLLWAPKPDRVAAVPREPTPSVSYSAVDGRLLDAQNAGDAPALRAALAAGANPNLLAPNGSSVLMLAAHRGQMEHIEALLNAGAQPDLRQTRKDSERGDTALLRAFYGGNLAAAQRLVQAGASLSARNRWDWGPMHMAAQSGCIGCLEWLAARDQLIDEPAPASRGETPAMLAASRGKVEALKWFAAKDVNLGRKDAHGKTALDWARFKKQAEAEQWLLERAR